MSSIVAFRATLDDIHAEKLDMIIENKSKNNAMFAAMLDLCLSSRVKFTQSMILSKTITKGFNAQCVMRNKQLFNTWDMVGYVVDIVDSLTEEQCAEVQRFSTTL